MEAHDFWNLAGRAGRWGDEFQGNIICIDPQDENAWPTGVPARARYPIKRESDAVLESGHGLADYLDKRASNDEAATEGSDQFEQVGAYLLSNFLREGSIADAGFAKRHSADIIGRLEASLSALAAQIEIDAKIVARHPGVSALGLQRLLKAFRAYEGNIENLVPATVESDDSYDRFITIMRRINTYLFPAYLLPPSHRVCLHAISRTARRSRRQAVSTSVLSAASMSLRPQSVWIAPRRWAVANALATAHRSYASGVVRPIA
jgi:hypothetical protein